MGSCIAKPIVSNENTKYPKYIPEITKGKVVKVYDGDTITIIGRVKHNPKLYKFSVRLAGIDCPEMRTHNDNEKEIAIKAKEYLVKEIFDKEITLKKVDTEKYGRLLAYVYLGKRCMNVELMVNNLAVPYDGGKKIVPDDWVEYWRSCPANII